MGMNPNFNLSRTPQSPELPRHPGAKELIATGLMQKQPPNGGSGVL
jgi:hypothetical protein